MTTTKRKIGELTPEEAEAIVKTYDRRLSPDEALARWESVRKQEADELEAVQECYDQANHKRAERRSQQP